MGNILSYAALWTHTRHSPPSLMSPAQPKRRSHLAGLYLLSSSSSVSLRMVMTLTGGLGVSGITMGWCCSCTGTSTLEEDEVERRGLLPIREYTWVGTGSRDELGLQEKHSRIQLQVRGSDKQH